MKIINSMDNSLIKKFRSLSVKKYREQFGLCLIEGEKVVKEALNQGLVEYLIISDQKEDKYLTLIEKYNNISLVVSDEVFNSLSFAVTTQGIVAVIKIKPSIEIGANNNILVLDHLQDPGNLGTIIRSCVASGHKDIILINSVDPYNDKTIRSASGTIFYPNFIKMTYEEFSEFVNKRNINLLVADMDGRNIYSDLKVKTPYALVIGNEGQGVGNEILALNHQKVSIPMQKGVESLNAGVSASIIMFHLANCKI